MQATISKGREGWEAQTDVELDAPYVLEIRTYKSQRGLVSNVTRFKNENGGKSFIMFGDFTERLILSKDRCTEKTVIAQHTAAMSDIEGIKARCAAFYAAQRQD